jgi:hypothetical protein
MTLLLLGERKVEFHPFPDPLPVVLSILKMYPPVISMAEVSVAFKVAISTRALFFLFFYKKN